MSDKVMNRDEIMRSLTTLANRLAQRGIQGEMYLVGGAAMALAYDARRVTRDIDAIFVPKAEVYREAQLLAEELGLPELWLNDAVKGFLAGTDVNATPVLDVPGLRVLAASPRYLLAMKCLASRREDESDIRFLLKRLGIQKVQDALDVVQQIYPDRKIPPRTQFFLEEVLGEYEPDPDPDQ